MATSLYQHTPYTALVRARDAAANVDPTPATRAFSVEPISLGGDPYAQAAAKLYFPDSVDLDVPATCAGSLPIDCPAGIAAAPAKQLRMQTSSLGAVYVAGQNRWDVTATISVQTLASFTATFSGSDCAASMNSAGGSSATWSAATQLQFTYTPFGDVNITPSSTSVAGLTSEDIVLSGNILCSIIPILSTGTAQNIMIETLLTYWQSVGLPLCEAPPPALVGPCPVE
jgi:hypothetical protein